MKTLGLYVHIPFCIQKCNYCDFISFDDKKEEDMIRYAHAVALDLEKWSTELEDYTIDTIFFGGGTPTVLSEKALELIIQRIYKCYKIADDIEFTIEANPKTFNKEKLLFYLGQGINRLSLGVQSLDDKLLKSLGRIHSSEDFYSSFYEAREAGFSNINTDIMFAIINQTVKDWEKTIENILDLIPEHISLYSLKIEENTPLFKMLKSGEIEEYDEDEDRNMFWYAINELKKKGYIHYEISNAALKGYNCKHNLKYWSMKDYLGVGVGAHSFLSGIRFSNETDLNKYIENANNKINNCVWNYHNTKNDNISEFIFTGLRKIDGISVIEFQKEFGITFKELFSKEMDDMIKKKYLEIHNKNLRLTNKGLDVSNSIMSRFLV